MTVARLIDSPYTPIYKNGVEAMAHVSFVDGADWVARRYFTLKEENSWKNSIVSALRDDLRLFASMHYVGSLDVHSDLRKLVAQAIKELGKYPDDHFPDEKISWDNPDTLFRIIIEPYQWRIKMLNPVIELQPVGTMNGEVYETPDKTCIDAVNVELHFQHPYSLACELTNTPAEAKISVLRYSVPITGAFPWWGKMLSTFYGLQLGDKLIYSKACPGYKRLEILDANIDKFLAPLVKHQEETGNNLIVLPDGSSTDKDNKIYVTVSYHYANMGDLCHSPEDCIPD